MLPQDLSVRCPENLTIWKQRYWYLRRDPRIFDIGSVRSNASFDNFLRVEVDGAVVDAENYDAKSGLIIVSLHADYLNALSVGEHTLAIVSRLDSGETKTTTKAKTVKTGDNSQMTVWLLMMVIAFRLFTVKWICEERVFCDIIIHIFDKSELKQAFLLDKWIRIIIIKLE